MHMCQESLLIPKLRANNRKDFPFIWPWLISLSWWGAFNSCVWCSSSPKIAVLICAFISLSLCFYKTISPTAHAAVRYGGGHHGTREEESDDTFYKWLLYLYDDGAGRGCWCTKGKSFFFLFFFFTQIQRECNKLSLSIPGRNFSMHL